MTTSNSVTTKREKLQSTITFKSLSETHLYALGCIIATAGAFLSVPMPFIIDGGIYIDMARAMAQEGALHIATNGGVEGAPPLTKYLTDPIGGLVYPQYPSGYAILAAPFYLIFGVHGLILINALSTVLCIWLTHQITKRLYTDKVGLITAIIFAAATFISNYAFSVWPHMLALAISLWATYCTVLGTLTRHRNRETFYMLFAGLLIGAAINIRVDTILLFPILFIWLRLFAAPKNRLTALLLTVGMAPGLSLATYLNYLKFGVVAPLSYGPSPAGDTDGRYIPLMIGGGGLMLALWVFNAPALAKAVLNQWNMRGAMLASVVGFLLVLLIAGDFLLKIVTGAYVLLINLQAHDAYYQAGVEHNQYGELLFWGYPKKALVQSLPFLPLLLLPIFSFIKGVNVRETSLCLLAIAAPITFYAMNQWHGGGSYNMRYFIPALPFIAILTAISLQTLFSKASSPTRQTLLIIFFSAALLFFFMQSVSNASERLFVIAALYPQWVIATICFVTVLLFIWQNGQRASVLTSTIGLFAIGYAAILGVADEAGGQKARHAQYTMSKQIAAALPDTSLVLTQLPVLLAHAEQNGASVMVVEEKNAAKGAKALTAFEKTDRCVVVHNSLVARLLETHLSPQTLAPEPVWVGKAGEDSRLAFYLLTSQQDACRS